MNSRAVMTLLAFAPILLHAQVCGDVHDLPSTKTVSVALQSKPESPAFYYREEADFTIFISQESLMRALSDREQDGDPVVKRLAPLIRARLPLKEDRDLYYFNLSDWLFYDSIRRVVALAIEQGNAAIVSAAGPWLSTVTVVSGRKVKMADTVIYADVGRNSRILTLLDCIVDSFLKVSICGS
jgi:hypothetical protein